MLGGCGKFGSGCLKLGGPGRIGTCILGAFCLIFGGGCLIVEGDCILGIPCGIFGGGCLMFGGRCPISVCCCILLGAVCIFGSVFCALTGGAGKLAG